MYRNNKTTGFKPLIINANNSNNSDSKCEPSKTQRKTSDQNKVRSTSKVLSLFKQSATNSNTEAKVTKDVKWLNKDVQNDEKECSVPIATADGKMIFSVLIGKKSTRKHKVWDDDGILEVSGKRAILKNSDSKIIGRTVVNPEALEEGFRLSIDSKEVEIVDKIENASDPGNITKEEVQEPPVKKQKTLTKKTFLPLVSTDKGAKTKPLIMPSINNSNRWLEDKVEQTEQEVSVDPCLANVLRPHQREGVVFLYGCIMGLKVPNYFGAILADEMGLGKTLQCITILWTLIRKGPFGKPVIKRALIVTPSSLCSNWDKEFSRWLGFHRITPYVVNTKNKPKDFKSQTRNPVMIISYDMLIRSVEELEEIQFDLMICDEGHRLKNNDIKAAKFLRAMDCKRRILLTGTPIQNDLQEFFALIDFVNPGILNSSHEYKTYYEDPIVASRCPHATDTTLETGKERAEELYELTKSFILRRTQETINKYLPAKHEIIIFCRLSSEQEAIYSQITDTWTSKSALPGTNISHLKIVTALKKVCNNAQLFDKENSDLISKNVLPTDEVSSSTAKRMSRQQYSGKITIVQTLMRNLRKTDEKLVLVSYFTQTLNLLEELCNAENIKFLRLDGSTTTKVRSKIVEQFNSKSGEHRVFLLSAKAGGVGLNLPGASRLVLFDSDWNPASDSQAMARIWRDGQKKDVYIYRLLSTGTIEEKIFQRQISKAGLGERVVDSKSFESLKFSMAELKDLFTLTKDTDCVTHDMMKCSCGGKKSREIIPKKTDFEDPREHQFFLQDDEPEQNLTINRLLEWEHYKEPFPIDIMKDIMLAEVYEEISFILKCTISKSKN